jgi:ribosome biogenesis GTPase
MQKENGLILKAIGGFYYVKTDDKVVECRGKGVFRNENIKPLVGDNVVIENINDKGTVSEILPRKNEFTRPPLANLDQLFFVISTIEPSPNTLIIDKLIAVAEYKDIEPIVVITKCDLEKSEKIKKIYQNAGFKVIDIQGDRDVEHLKTLLSGKINAFVGNSGVGKSTLLNKIDKGLNIETNEISKKLGRGKHTTREVNLYPLESGGYIADTPGFSSIEIDKYEIIYKDKLQYCFREFEPYIQNCKFKGCSHTGEKGCEVCEALKEGKIEKSRYESYLALYEDASKINFWELKK